jgi:hypothetical protein
MLLISSTCVIAACDSTGIPTPWIGWSHNDRIEG